MTGKIAGQVGEKLGQGFDVAKGIAGKGMEKAGQLGEKITGGIGYASGKIKKTVGSGLEKIKSTAVSVVDRIRGKKKPYNPYLTPVAPVPTPSVKPPVSAPTAPVAPVVSPPVKPPVSAPTAPVAPRKSSFIDYISKKASDLYGGITGKTAQARRAAEAATEEALDLVEYSDDAKKYMSTLSKEQLASFRELAKNGTSTEKQAKLMKDTIESAAKDNLRFIEGDSYLKHQQDLVDMKIISSDKAKERMSYTRGSYSEGKGIGGPRISINPKKARKTTRLHELAHFADDFTGNLYGEGASYASLQKTVGTGLEKFLDGPQYQAITDGLESSYTGSEIRNKPFELFTILTQGKADKATSHLFTKGSTAQEILNTLWQARGYQKGGTVYASNGALMSVQPKGTDTVPAMLTPGEFVVNRESTQQYLPLLRSINSGNYAGGGLTKYMAQGGVVTPQYKAVGGETSGGSQYSKTPLSTKGSTEDARLDKIEKSIDKFVGIATTFEKASESMGNSINQFSQSAASMPTQMSHSLSAVVNGSISNSTGAATQIVNSRHEAQIVVDQNNQRMDRANEGAFSRSDPTIIRGSSGAGGSAHA
jgi:hypothetical protein